MIFLEVVMILIGLGAVVLSTVMPENRSLKGTVQGTGVNIDYEQLTKEHLERYREIIEEMSEDVKNEAEDRMNNISNEKIMGISEYSDQVLDRIEKNHAEVVFLYNMLNEKQDEMKELVAETDKTKAELRDELSALYQDNMKLIRESKEEFMENMEQRIQDGLEHLDRTPKTNTKAKPQPAIPSVLQKVVKTGTRQADGQPAPVSEQPAKQSEETSVGVFQHKEEILDLHKKGHSVLDISRLLSIGQGEVSFVIELYGN